MQELENIKTLYIYEQNLLKTCTNKLLEAWDENLHDNILLIFDNIDELNRKLHNYIKDNTNIKKESLSKKKKETLYEEFDSMLLRISN